jgi:hypothetical protein
VFECFSEFTPASKAFERTQVFNRTIGHDMREEVRWIGQSFRGCLEPHHSLSHG